MDRYEPQLVSRARIAEYAGVSRAAVTNWQKRDAAFPLPTNGDGELFDLGQVIDWLSSRRIPGNARYTDEAVGATYADRIRTNAAVVSDEPLARPGATETCDGASRTPGSKDGEERRERDEGLVLRVLDSLRGSVPLPETLRALLDVLHIKLTEEALWEELLRRAELGLSPGTLPERLATKTPLQLRSFFDHLSPQDFHKTIMEIESLGSPGGLREGVRAAFDRVLTAMEDSGTAEGILRTPASVVEMVTGLLTFGDVPQHIHDPFCRTGEFLIAIDQRLRSDAPSAAPVLSGTTATSDEAHTARMHLNVHGVEADIRSTPAVPGQALALPRVDVVVANPPFNQRSQAVSNRYFPYGQPPKSNENFAWLQHAIAMLKRSGRAGILMPTNAAFSMNSKERAIRSAMVEDGAVECVMSLPDKLFQDTSIPVALWMLCHPTGSCSEVLFVDASDLGTMVSRTKRSFSPEDIRILHETYTTWRDGNPENPRRRIGRAVPIEEIRSRDHSLHPPSYVTTHEHGGTKTQQVDRFEELTRELASLDAQVTGMDAEVESLLREVRRWMR